MKKVSPCESFGVACDPKFSACKDCGDFFTTEFLECQMRTKGYSKWGHKLDTKAGMIDDFISEGTYSVSEIEKEIESKLGKCRKYSVREHLSHLRKHHNINANVDLDKKVKIIV